MLAVTCQNLITTTTKAENAVFDLKYIVNAIDNLGIDLHKMADAQPMDRDFRQLSTDARTGLPVKFVWPSLRTVH